MTTIIGIGRVSGLLHAPDPSLRRLLEQSFSEPIDEAPDIDRRYP